MCNEEERMQPVMTPWGKDSEAGRWLYMALELSEQKWLVGFTVGLGQKPRRRWVAGGDVAGVMGEVAGQSGGSGWGKGRGW